MTGRRQGPAAARAPRLFVEAALASGAAVEPGPDATHYLLRVMRRGVGDAVLLFNGQDGEWRAEIAGTGRRDCRLTVIERTRPQIAGPDLWLLFAPVKRLALDLLARQATELGVALLQPVITARTVAARVNTGRLAANAREAAEQCGRLDLPEVREPATLAEILKHWPDGRRLYLCDESGGGRPAAAVFAAAGGGPAALLCGPEGGFAPEELDGFDKLAFADRVGLGPRILRAGTAAAAALAVWQATAGDWRQAPRTDTAG